MTISNRAQTTFTHLKLATRLSSPLLGCSSSTLQVGSSPLSIRQRATIAGGDLLPDSTLNERYTIRRQIWQGFSLSRAYETASAVRPAREHYLLRTSRHDDEDEREGSENVCHQASGRSRGSAIIFSGAARGQL